MKIFGQVTDTNREPMSLANITIVANPDTDSLAINTDFDGNFELENESISPDSEFKISYIGYVPQTLKASDLQGQKIKLAQNLEVLDNNVLSSVSSRPKSSKKSNSVESTKQKFIQHLQDHKFIYATIGAIAGIILIVRAFKNKK